MEVAEQVWAVVRVRISEERHDVVELASFCCSCVVYPQLEFLEPEALVPAGEEREQEVAGRDGAWYVHRLGEGRAPNDFLFVFSA